MIHTIFTRSSEKFLSDLKSLVLSQCSYIIQKINKFSLRVSTVNVTKSQETVNLVTFTEGILNRKLYICPVYFFWALSFKMFLRCFEMFWEKLDVCYPNDIYRQGIKRFKKRWIWRKSCKWRWRKGLWETTIQRCSLKKHVLKICFKFTGEHQCRTPIFRTPFPENRSGLLLLNYIFVLMHIFTYNILFLVCFYFSVGVFQLFKLLFVKRSDPVHIYL